MGFLEGGPWSAGNIVEGDGVEVAKDGCRDVAGGPVGSDRSASPARVQAVSCRKGPQCKSQQSTYKIYSHSHFQESYGQRATRDAADTNQGSWPQSPESDWRPDGKFRTGFAGALMKRVG